MSDENQRQTMALLSSNKQIKEMSIDRLSVLPDSLLFRILSLLCTNVAVRTSVLSKRWKFLWAELPRLEFWERPNINHDIDKTRCLVSLVNRTFSIRKSNYLEELSVSLVYEECFASDVDSWIEFSVKNQVKKISLIIFLNSNDDNYYMTPQILYSSSSLTDLYLKSCVMTLETSIEWQSLTRLSLANVVLSQRLIDGIISSCPVLYSLDLEGCWGFNRLEVDSRCLNCLKVQESYYGPYLEISAPYVRVLDIRVFLKGRKCQLKNIPSAVKASIAFIDFDDVCTVEVMSNAKIFLENIKHIKELQLWTSCFEVLSTMAVNGWQLPQSMVQHLVLPFHSEYKHSMSGIIGLLESSPNLETLLLVGYETEGETVNLDPGAKSDLDCDLLHLKTITVKNLADSNGEPLLTLVRILLRRTPALEKMRIAIDVEDKSEFVSIGQKLLTYPRSSKKAEILFFQHRFV